MSYKYLELLLTYVCRLLLEIWNREQQLKEGKPAYQIVDNFNKAIEIRKTVSKNLNNSISVSFISN